MKNLILVGAVLFSTLTFSQQAYIIVSKIPSNYNWSAIGGYVGHLDISEIDSITFFTPTPGSLPSLSTIPPSQISNFSVTAGINIENYGDGLLTQFGFCWSTSPNPTLSDNFSSLPIYDGPQYNGFLYEHLGITTSNMTNLIPNTTYYFRSYASNDFGTSYGNEFTFTTAQSLPTVVLNSVDIFNHVQAYFSGNVTNDGSANVTQRGVCVSTTENPTLNDLVTLCGSGMGQFYCSINNLTPGTQYYARGFALTQYGVGYSQNVTFTTYGQPELPSVSSLEPTNVHSVSFTARGFIHSTGNLNLNQRGFCWSLTNPLPTLDDQVHQVSSYLLDSLFSTTISLGFVPGTTIYYRAYAMNSVGIDYGDVYEVVLLPYSQPGSGLYDIDGNFYETRVFSYGREWMTSNLRTTTYKTGVPIPLLTSSYDWGNAAGIGRYCYYNNDTSFINTYGLLYNFGVVSSQNVCPTGWSVPTHQQWTDLENSLGGPALAGTLMKADTLWESWSGIVNSNESGFNAIPSGMRSSASSISNYTGLGTIAVFWTRTTIVVSQSGAQEAYRRMLSQSSNSVTSSYNKLTHGQSIRCIKDL